MFVSCLQFDKDLFIVDWVKCCFTKYFRINWCLWPHHQMNYHAPSVKIGLLWVKS